jgi:hypothetical protein
MKSSTQLIVARDDLQQCKFIETSLPAVAGLPAESLLIKVDRFTFTANNITYAVLGDRLKYWQLFPAPQGFGNIPVWGFGDVIASNHPNVSEGERPTRSASAPRNGGPAGSRADSATRGRASSRCSTAGSR